jgi:hypothetical protein
MSFKNNYRVRKREPESIASIGEDQFSHGLFIQSGRQLAFSNEGVSLTFKTHFCLQLVFSRQAYVAKTSDQFCHVSTRHALKIWEDIILSTKTCDVIKRGFPRLKGRPLFGSELQSFKTKYTLLC